MAIPDSSEATLKSLAEVAVKELGPQSSLFNHGADGVDATTAPDNVWAGAGLALDTVRPEPGNLPPTRRKDPKTRAELLAELARRGLRAYPRKLALPQLGSSLKTEEKPELNDMSDISRAVAARLEISDRLRADAIKAALNRIKEKEHHTELTTGDGYIEEIRVFTDRNALAREAFAALRTLPQAEEEDYRLIVQALASRLRAGLDDELDNLPPRTPSRPRLSACAWRVMQRIGWCASARRNCWRPCSARSRSAPSWSMPNRCPM
jgi:hypothetical protein